MSAPTIVGGIVAVGLSLTISAMFHPPAALNFGIGLLLGASCVTIARWMME